MVGVHRPDLGRIFESEPWLVREPGADAQADVLSHLTVMPLTAFQSAMEALVKHSVPQDMKSSTTYGCLNTG